MLLRSDICLRKASFGFSVVDPIPCLVFPIPVLLHLYIPYCHLPRCTIFIAVCQTRRIYTSVTNSTGNIQSKNDCSSRMSNTTVDTRPMKNGIYRGPLSTDLTSADGL